MGKCDSRHMTGLYQTEIFFENYTLVLAQLQAEPGICVLDFLL